MITVVNKKTHKITDDDLYIGRPSIWGNPFVIGRDGSRDNVIKLYTEWVVNQSEIMARLTELRGKNLVCWCAPALCHGDVLKLLCEDLTNGDDL